MFNEDSIETEQFWIDYFKFVGADLTNYAKADGHRSCLTPEERKERRKISLKKYNNRNHLAWRIKNREHVNKWANDRNHRLKPLLSREEHNKRLSEGHKRRKLSC